MWSIFSLIPQDQTNTEGFLHWPSSMLGFHHFLKNADYDVMDLGFEIVVVEKGKQTFYRCLFFISIALVLNRDHSHTSSLLSWQSVTTAGLRPMFPLLATAFSWMWLFESGLCPDFHSAVF